MNRLTIVVKFLNWIDLRPFIHGRKDQHKSCTAHHGEPLLCPCLRTTCYFFGYFLGWVMLLHPQATSTDHGGPHGDYEDLFIRLSYGMQ